LLARTRPISSRKLGSLDVSVRSTQRVDEEADEVVECIVDAPRNRLPITMSLPAPAASAAPQGQPAEP